jgi:hypothetical protein
MKTEQAKKRGILLAALVVTMAAIGVLLFPVHKVAAPKIVAAKTHLAAGHGKPVSRRVKVAHTRVHRQRPVAKPVIAPAQDQGLNQLPVQFPKPTKITIAVAGDPRYSKLDGHDHPLKDDSPKWNCVSDHSTGLVWEVKTSDRGLRDAQNFYSWYNPNRDSNGGFSGQANHGKCRGGISCDTRAYVAAVNRMKLCGFSDWRLPTRRELMSLVQYHLPDKNKGLIDTRYFPAANSDWYWSADSDVSNARYAWYVLYYNGREMKAPKSQAKRIRLVRGQMAPSPRTMARQAPGSDKTIAHTSTGTVSSAGGVASLLAQRVDATPVAD